MKNPSPEISPPIANPVNSKLFPRSFNTLDRGHLPSNETHDQPNVSLQAAKRKVPVYIPTKSTNMHLSTMQESRQYPQRDEVKNLYHLPNADQINQMQSYTQGPYQHSNNPSNYIQVQNQEEQNVVYYPHTYYPFAKKINPGEISPKFSQSQFQRRQDRGASYTKALHDLGGIEDTLGSIN